MTGASKQANEMNETKMKTNQIEISTNCNREENSCDDANDERVPKKLAKCNKYYMSDKTVQSNPILKERNSMPYN